MSKINMSNFANFKDDTLDIIQSRLISKATAADPNGGVVIIAVFEKSTYHKFFHVFRAPSSRTRRARWTYTYQYAGIHSFGDSFFTLRSYLSSVYPHSLKTWTVRHLFRAGVLADLTKRISDPFKYGKIQNPIGAENFRYVGRYTARAQSIRRRGF